MVIYRLILAILVFSTISVYAQSMATKRIIIDTIIDERTEKKQNDIYTRYFTLIEAHLPEEDTINKVEVSKSKWATDNISKEYAAYITNTKKEDTCFIAVIKSSQLDSVDVHLLFDDKGSRIIIKNIGTYPEDIHIKKWVIRENYLPKPYTFSKSIHKVLDSNRTTCYNCWSYRDTGTYYTPRYKPAKRMRTVINGTQYVIYLTTVLSDPMINIYHGYPNKRQQRRHDNNMYPYKKFSASYESSHYYYKGEVSLLH